MAGATETHGLICKHCGKDSKDCRCRENHENGTCWCSDKRGGSPTNSAPISSADLAMQWEAHVRQFLGKWVNISAPVPDIPSYAWAGKLIAIHPSWIEILIFEGDVASVRISVGQIRSIREMNEADGIKSDHEHARAHRELERRDRDIACSHPTSSDGETRGH